MIHLRFSFNNLNFITYFDKSLPNLSNFIYKIFIKSFENYSINVKSYFKRQPNLMNYLVNNIRFPFISKCYNKCIDISCKICKLANTSKILSNNLDLPINIPVSSSCNSKFCIYILKCFKCNL